MPTFVKYLLIFVTGWAVDFFLFPIEYPLFSGRNTKQMLAVIGLVILGMQILRYRKYELSRQMIGAVLIVLAFSIWNLFATVINGFFDLSYATYINSALVWFFSAYTCTSLMAFVHGKVTIRLVVSYLAVVCALQCILAIAIDKSDFVHHIMNDYIIDQRPLRLEDIGRLYGLACALDIAGVRFAAVQLLIAFVVCVDEKVRQDNKLIFFYLCCFFVIAALGNIISRTTITGVGLGLLAMGLSTGIYRLRILGSSLKMTNVMIGVLAVGIPIAVFLYYTDTFFYNQFRYGFESFFNLFEKGEFRSDSTDVLQTMWRWPWTTKIWIIGTGEFDGFRWGTDIGYCRHILYSGLIGFSLFSFFFIYNAGVFMQKYKRYRYMFLFLLALTFIIWIKVSTDLFQFYALFYAFVDREEESYQPNMPLLG